MTVVHNRPNDSIRAIINKARNLADGRQAQKDRGVIKLYRKGVTARFTRKRTPESQEKYDAVVAEARKLGLPPPVSRDKKFKGLPKKSPHKVNVSLTPSQIRDVNKKLLLKKLAETTRIKTALTKKAEADKIYGSNKRSKKYSKDI